MTGVWGLMSSGGTAVHEGARLQAGSAGTAWASRSMRGASRRLVVGRHDGEPVAPRDDTEPALARDGETVLTVDDEPLVLQTNTRLLAALGYRVAACASGAEAIEYLRERHADLLLLDLLMPGIDGVETFRLIRSFKPAQKAVVLSGYAHPEKVEAVRALGIRHYLVKPVPLHLLARTVRDALDASPAA